MRDATRVDVERFRDAIAQRLGLRFDDARLAFLEGVLQRRLEAEDGAAAAYLERLEHPHAPAAELAALAQELTVGETYFFRHREQFDAFRELAVPERLKARAVSRELCVLSAGCASGEEPYSLAILLRELCPTRLAQCSCAASTSTPPCSSAREPAATARGPCAKRPTRSAEAGSQRRGATGCWPARFARRWHSRRAIWPRTARSSGRRNATTWCSAATC